jgi:hypothetical protein
MKIKNYSLKIATKNMLPELIHFSDAMFRPENDAIYNDEFLCKQGLRSSILKGYVIAAFADESICGMMRFYPQKRIKQISIYQFTVAKANRGEGIVAKMLTFLHEHYDGPIVCKCPKGSSFNNYYFKTGWRKVDENGYCHWEW